MIEMPGKEYQAGYDFALNQLKLLVDHELKVSIQRPTEAEEEEREVAEETNRDAIVNPSAQVDANQVNTQADT